MVWVLLILPHYRLIVGRLRWWTILPTYLDSVVSSDGEILEDIWYRLAKASWVFGSLRLSIFANGALWVGTRWAVYQTTVLAVLLYGTETWILKTPHLKCLTVFHNHCVRTILGISRYEQWQQYHKSAALLYRFGTGSISRIIVDKCFHWLSHICSISIIYCNNVVPIIRIWMERVYSIVFIYKINHVVSLRVVSLESTIVHGDRSGIGRQNNFTWQFRWRHIR